MGQRLAIVSLAPKQRLPLTYFIANFLEDLAMSKEKPRYNEIIFLDIEEQNIVDMYTEQNMSTVKIAKVYGCNHHKIEHILEKHDIPRTGASRRKYKLNEAYFDFIDNQNKAYILGFLFADGYNSIPKHTVTMSLQEDDKEILEKIRCEIGSEKELEFLDYSNKHDFGYTYKNQWRLNMFSKHMCDSLDKLGMHQNKSLILEFPDIDKSLYRHFIRGYFDGDGDCIDT